jgi:hypothetical protein
MGKQITDAPDTWCFLRESYLKEKGGRPLKNFERWLYQRDMEGFETTPAIKIEQAIKMWMVQPDKYYDYIAREGKKIGFDVEDNWAGLNGQVAVKISYFDNYKGELNLAYNNGKKLDKKSVKLQGDGTLKTATFFLPKLQSNGMINKFDFVLEAGINTEKIVVSFVRVIQANEVKGIEQ